MSGSNTNPEVKAKGSSDLKVVRVSVPLDRVAQLVEMGQARNPIPSIAESGIVSRDLEPQLSMVVNPEGDEQFDAEWMDVDALTDGDLVVESLDHLIRDAKSALLNKDLVVALELFERALASEASDEFAGFGVSFCRFMLKPRREMEPVMVDRIGQRLEAGPEAPWLRFFAAQMCHRADRLDEACDHLSTLRTQLVEVPELALEVSELGAKLGEASAPEPSSPPRAPSGPRQADPRPRASLHSPSSPPVLVESFFERPVGGLVAVMLVTVLLGLIGFVNTGTSNASVFWVRVLTLAVFTGILLATVFRARISEIIEKQAGLLPVLGGLGVGLLVGQVLPPFVLPAGNPSGVLAACLVQVAAVEGFFRLYVDHTLFGRVPSHAGIVVISAFLFGLLAVHDPSVLGAASWADALLRTGLFALAGGVPFALVHVATRSVVPPFLCHLTAQVVAVFGA